jgi:hypothetical protein
MAAARIAALLAGDRQQREAAFGELGSLAGAAPTAEAVDVASACVAPLISLLCADASRIASAEARRVGVLLGALMLLDPVKVGAEYVRDDRFLPVWTTPSSALAFALSQEPAALTRDDVMLMACNLVPMAVVLSRGMTAIATYAGADEPGIVMTWAVNMPFFASSGNVWWTDERNKQLMLRVLDICRKPEGVTPLELTGVWTLCADCIATRPAVATASIDAGMFDVGMSELHKSSPSEWITWCTPAGLIAGQAMHALNVAVWATSGLVNASQLLSESGVGEAILSGLQAYELRGPGHTSASNPSFIVLGASIIACLDLASPEAKDVLSRVRGMPTTLQFMLDNPADFLKMVGMTTGATAGPIASSAFGKEEEDGFVFAQETVDDVIAILSDQFSGPLAGWFPICPAHYLTPVHNLCISDANKSLLVKSSRLIQLLLEALFLDPAHARQDTPDKAPIQQAAAECFLQLAVFKPGRELLMQDPAIAEALQALAGGKAMTKQAQLAATTALVAIEGVTSHREPELEDDSEQARHIMVSYQWVSSFHASRT